MTEWQTLSLSQTELIDRHLESLLTHFGSLDDSSDFLAIVLTTLEAILALEEKQRQLMDIYGKAISQEMKRRQSLCESITKEMWNS